MKIVFLLLCVLALFGKSINAQSYNWDDVEISHYEIHLSLTDISSKFISGHTVITTISQKNGLDSVFYYLEDLTIDSIRFDGTVLTSYTHDNDSIIKIELPAAVNDGDTFQVAVYYHGQPKKEPYGFGGFHFSSDNLYAYNMGAAIMEKPQSYGRVWFPCIDSFKHKALYDLYITTTTPAFAVSGGTLINKTDDVISGTTLTHWRIQQKIHPYLLSLNVSDYVLVTDTFFSAAGKIPVDIFVRQPDSANVHSSFIHLMQLLEGFEERFGTYLWDKAGYVGVPFNGGAMEHAMNIAYPRFAINGGLSYEYLIAHELAHSWFGNLVTCATAGEMWINEGWARFAEIVYMEIVYGHDASRNYFRNKHKDVLHKTHKTDNGYYAVHGVPHDLTYSSTVYDKGGVVVHSMRHYLGDSLFFDAVKAYTDSFKFKTVSTVELRDFFSWHTGVDLTGFFDAWLFRPGFSAFVVDSFHVNPIGQNFQVQMWFQQKLKGTTQYAFDNRFDILFLGPQFEEHTENIALSGQSGMKEFTLPFHPVALLIDPLDKTAFATTKDDIVVKDADNLILNHSLTRLNISDPGSDSIRLFVRHHWVAPDGDADPGLSVQRLSDYRYWEIDGIIPSEANIELTLQYNRTVSSAGNLDNTLLPTTASADSLILLYRPNAAFHWMLIPFTKTGNAHVGLLTTPSLKPGQYTFAVGEPGQSDIPIYKPQNLHIMKVFPNPSNGQITIEIDSDCPQPSIRIFNSMGKQIECTKPVEGKNSVVWDPGDNPSGMYIIQLHDRRRKVMLDSKSIIYEK
jgi:hypothetical protein